MTSILIDQDNKLENKHRYIVGGLFLCHGLVRTALALMILSSNIELNFSAVMITIGMAVPSLFGGYNLLVGNNSAHSILSIAAFINLFSLPDGTALSIYYYWYWKYQCGAPNPFATSSPTSKALAE